MNRNSILRSNIIGLLLLLAVISSIIETAGVSLSFYIGILLLLVNLRYIFLLKKISVLILIFILGANLSGFISNSQLSIQLQLIYWFSIYQIITNSYDFINKKLLAKYVLLSLIILFIAKIILQENLNHNLVGYTFVLGAPLVFSLIKKNITRYIVCVIYASMMLYNGSRTGFVISIVQIAMIIYFMSIKKRSSFALIFFALLLLTSFSITSFRTAIGEMVIPYNERIGSLLTNYDEITSSDKSLYVRRAQQVKGIELFIKNPVFGVGPNNFSSSKINIDNNRINMEISGEGLKVDNRSSHNSYISILSETGIVGVISFISFIIVCVVSFTQKVKKLRGTFEFYIYISLLGMILNFWNITAIYSTYTWIYLALVAGAYCCKSKYKSKIKPQYSYINI